MTIANPVLPGFHPDPSMIRVGDTYYIASSTFEWWPGVRIHESKDLSHWNYVGSALDRVSQLNMRGNPSSGGIWAPDLSWADGKFWLIFTDVKNVNGAFKDCANYLVTAEDIRGPWSEPIRLNGVGFDASLFHDDDGRKYLVQQTWDHREYHHAFDGITITELDVDTMRLMPETTRTLWEGTDVKVTEGPHLYKINGWYYLFAAEGGTQYEHQESVARSRSLDMPFEVMPNNPLIGNYDAPDGYLQKQGHGALVDTPSGEWYYASLCGRPWRHDIEPSHGVRGWCTLGRETSIQKIEWDDDGWPYVVGGRAGTRCVEAPKDAILTGAPKDHSQHDEFEDDVLGPDWNTLRVPFDEHMGEVGDGRLVLRGQGSLCNLFELSLVARRWQAFDFDAETKLSFDPKHYMAMAGLTNYYSDMFWSWVFVTYDERRRVRVIEVAQNDNGDYTSFLKDDAIAVPDGVDVWLRTRVRTAWYTYEYSFDGEHWHEIPVKLDAKVLSDDYVAQRYGGFFTGGFVGLAAVDVSGYGEEATFHHFDYREFDQPGDNR
ncbi:glycoside hydrolase family 43 protein [Bifidobacterium margollesii]|uniref:glycoside hydrolase family 43 protein n=1 Tax=Bifidobacterium margollesii TaxID=2020964 RepID=UPI000C776A51|nr:glycoside hydrolase family 43 protein [Bifidobacterium margollesii]